VAALVQDYKFGTILGEETSDMATTHGAMEQFKLPKTGIAVGYPKARIVRPNGDLRARGVTPDIVIRIPAVETPEDEVLQPRGRHCARTLGSADTIHFIAKPAVSFDTISCAKKPFARHSSTPSQRQSRTRFRQQPAGVTANLISLQKKQ